MEVNVNTVMVMIAEDHHLVVQAIAAQLNINQEAVRQILTTKLGMKYVCAV